MENKEYDLITARHYAAYRPPLHVPVLKFGLAENERFRLALDVGCGTGISTHALGRWCHHVVGTDPSKAMIQRARPGSGVSFKQQPGKRIDSGLEENTFDLIVFAGSLFYLEIDAVLMSLKRLLASGGTVIVYDFDVLLQPVFNHLNVRMPESNYDHGKNLTGTSVQALRVVRSRFEVIPFEATSQELAHLLCAVRTWRDGPLAKYSYTDLTKLLPGTVRLKANTWLTRYAL